MYYEQIYMWLSLRSLLTANQCSKLFYTKLNNLAYEAI